MLFIETESEDNMINARPNMNGNSEKDFFDAAVKLSEAIGAVEEALANIQSNVLHGRNYQTIPDWQQNSALGGDDAQMKHARKQVSELQYFAQQVANRAMSDA